MNKNPDNVNKRRLKSSRRPLPTVPGSEVEIQKDGSFVAVPRSPEDRVIVPDDETPALFDFKSHFSKTSEKTLLGLKRGQERYGASTSPTMTSPEVYCEMKRCIQTIEQLGRIVGTPGVARTTELDGVRALVDIGLSVGSELNRLSNWRDPLKTHEGKLLGPGRILVEEISKTYEEFPAIRTNNGALKEGTGDIPLRPYELGKPRSFQGAIDLFVQQFADYVLHYPQSSERTRYWFSPFGTFRVEDDVRRWLMQPGQRHDVREWAVVFRDCIIFGLKRLKRKSPELAQSGEKIRSQWGQELMKIYGRTIGKGRSITTNTFESLLLRRARERLRPIVRRQGNRSAK
jgi:hypothetical protein